MELTGNFLLPFGYVGFFFVVDTHPDYEKNRHDIDEDEQYGDVRQTTIIETVVCKVAHIIEIHLCCYYPTDRCKQCTEVDVCTRDLFIGCNRIQNLDEKEDDKPGERKFEET